MNVPKDNRPFPKKSMPFRPWNAKALELDVEVTTMLNYSTILIYVMLFFFHPREPFQRLLRSKESRQLFF